MYDNGGENKLDKLDLTLNNFPKNALSVLDFMYYDFHVNLRYLFEN